MDIEESKTRFYNNIKRLREKNHMTLAELSKYSGLSLSMLEQLDQNILPKDMMVDDAVVLAQIFHCNTWELFK